ncbi:MAG: hypothetical protein AVDCRST_MAG93-8531, partial [uncultured Chloroflexia bacterium]
DTVDTDHDDGADARDSGRELGYPAWDRGVHGGRCASRLDCGG